MNRRTVNVIHGLVHVTLLRVLRFQVIDRNVVTDLLLVPDPGQIVTGNLTEMITLIVSNDYVIVFTSLKM